MDTFWDDKLVGDIHFVNFGDLDPICDVTLLVERAQNGAKHKFIEKKREGHRYRRGQHGGFVE